MRNKKTVLKRICAYMLSAMFVLPYFSVGVIQAQATDMAKNDEDEVVLSIPKTTEVQSSDEQTDEEEVLSNNEGDTEKTEEEKLQKKIEPLLKDKIAEQLQENLLQENSNKKYSLEELKEIIKLIKEIEKEEKKKQKEQKPVITDGTYVVEAECFDVTQPDRYSMANAMFAKDVDMKVQGAVTELKFYVPYPVPAFSNLGADGTIKNFYIEYENQKYQAKSDITTKPLKPMRETNAGFGLEKDKAIPTQILTVEIPTAAISGKEIIFKAGGYVNVVMDKDVELLLKLSKIPANETMVPLFSVDGKEVMVPNWLATMLKSGKFMGGGNNSGNNSGNNNSGNNASGNSSNTNNSTTLSDGVYSVTGNVLKAGGSGYSMANDAIEHTMYITVKGGKAHLILTFKGLALNGMYGYLGYLNYFENMNDNTPYKSEVLSRQTANGTVVSDTYGTNYPKDIMFPLPSEAMNTGKVSVQVFVPIMESISKGNGTQKAILELSVNNLTKVGDNADTFINSRKEGAASDTTKQTTDNAKELKLDDGIYKIGVSMLKTDKTSLSMANNSVNHIAKLRVEGGKYYLTLRFNPMNIGGKAGYLGTLKFYTPSYTLNNGDITGTLKDSYIDEYHTKDGKNIVDVYGTDYPKACTVEVIESARKDGFVALNVFVPVMDKISKGAGSQNVFAKLDISSVVKTNNDDPEFLKADSSDSGNEALNGKSAKAATDKELTDSLSSETSETEVDDSKVPLSQTPMSNIPSQRVVTQYVPVSSSQPQLFSQDGQSNGYTAFPQMNPYYQNAYMPYPYYMNQGIPHYSQNMGNENQQADTAEESKKADAIKENKNITAIGTVIISGMSGIGTALGIVFKKFL